MKQFTFKAIIQDGDGGGAFVIIPFDVEKEFGKKRLPVQAWIEGEPYRSTLVRYGSPDHMLVVLKEIRNKIGKTIGDEVEIILQEDTAPRQVEIPEDMQQALENDPEAKAAFLKLSYTHQKEHVHALWEAKQPQTRLNRLEKMLVSLKKG